MDIKISENLRSLRIKSKKSLEDVAEIIDVSRQSVSKWESGESYPDIIDKTGRGNNYGICKTRI